MPVHDCSIRTFCRKGVSRTVNQRVSDETGNGVHPKNENRHRPSATPVPDFQYPVQESQEGKCKSTREEYKRTRPKVFVDREPLVPQQPDHEANNSRAQQTKRLRTRITL